MANESTATPVTISEVSGSNRQVVELAGRALPYRPTEYVGEQRIKRRDYVGSSVADIQVLGPKEEPLVLKGKFKDVFLGAGKAKELRNRLDAIRRRGRLVEVRWSDLVRQGILRRASFTHDRDQDIAFELTFEIRSQGESPAPVAANTVQAGSTFIAQANDLVDRMRQRILDMEAALVDSGPVANILSAAEGGISLLENVQDSVSTGLIQADMSLDVARNLIARARELVTGFRDLYDELADFVPAVQTEGQGIAAEVRLTLAQRDMESDAKDSIVLGNTLESNVLAFAQPDVAASVTLSPGQDLRSVAAAFLGTADAWERIADFNDLKGSQQPPGTLVFIPRG